jgi:NADPH:quinone reductase-like Zn-dependent oxidoreductase
MSDTMEAKMKAAVVVQPAQPPVYSDFNDPAPAPGKSVVRVTASALSHVTKTRAGGGHYSFQSATSFVPGIDGTGVTESGERVYFFLPEHPYGGMAPLCLVDERHCVTLPRGLEDTFAAAIAIPGMSSWAALKERAHLKPGETILINGATGTSGRMAIQVAKHLGARTIIATGRRGVDELRALGAEITITLVDDRNALEQRFREVFHQGVDIVLDYLWGSSAETLIIAAAKAAPAAVPIRYVQIGSISGGDITLPSAALRSSSLQLMGSGIASVPFPKLQEAVREVLQTASAGKFTAAVKAMPLSEVSRAWVDSNPEARIVLVP